MRKECELCNYPARMYCESDNANLCWDCDEKIHSANFLVARHSRSLLCNVCQSVTNWSASGLKLGHTVSVCHGCVLVANNDCMCTDPNNCCESHHRHHRDEDEHEDDDDVSDRDSDVESDDEEDEDEVVEEEDDDEENQVVPWTSTPPPPATSSSSSSSGGEGGDVDADEASRRSRFRGLMTLKRRREDTDRDSDFDDEIVSQSGNYNTISTSLTLCAPGQIDSIASIRTSVRPMKVLRASGLAIVERGQGDDHEANGNADPISVIDTLKRYEQRMISNNSNVAAGAAAAVTVGIRKLSRDPTLTGFN